MTEEKINVVDEKVECNCPVCKFLKSDCTKKFIAMTLASFIGCSLAILAFAPKKPAHFKKCPPPYMKMYDRPIPPPEFHKYHHKMKYHQFKKDDFRRDGDFKRGRDFRYNNDFKRIERKDSDFKKGCPKKFNEAKQPTPPAKDAK